MDGWCFAHTCWNEFSWKQTQLLHVDFSLLGLAVLHLYFSAVLQHHLLVLYHLFRHSHKLSISPTVWSCGMTNSCAFKSPLNYTKQNNLLSLHRLTFQSRQKPLSVLSKQTRVEKPDCFMMCQHVVKATLHSWEQRSSDWDTSCFVEVRGDSWLWLE